MQAATLLFKLIAQRASEWSVAELPAVTSFTLCEEKNERPKHTQGQSYHMG
jgi:hypothetical protein